MMLTRLQAAFSKRYQHKKILINPCCFCGIEAIKIVFRSFFLSKNHATLGTLVRKILSTYFFSETLVYLIFYLFIYVIFQFEVVFYLLYLRHILWVAVLRTFFDYANNCYDLIKRINQH